MIASRLVAASVAAFFAAGFAGAQTANDYSAAANAAAEKFDFNRNVLSKMGIDQHEGVQVPGDAVFQDEHGRTIHFGDLYGKRPLVVMPMYFNCPGICGVETDSLLEAAIQMKDRSIGRDYDIVLLSINPTETPKLTFPRWQGAEEMYGRPGSDEGFHFLTGTYPNILKVTNALGFKYVYNPKDGTINHPAGLMVLSPTGIVTGYIVNKDFPAVFLDHMIQDASASKISPKIDTVLFGCIMVDPATGHRSLIIENVIRLIAGLFAIGVACWITSMSLSGRHKGGAA
ncbi:MAG TPA: SCO family protein [Fimbriimonadaceae bacterium]|nr:SCO family protein [Fimbriimonadaceae bacterium]